MSIHLWGAIIQSTTVVLSFPGGSVVKNLSAVQGTQVQSLSWEDFLEKEMTTHSIFLPGEFHGQKSLAGYSHKRVTKELDTKELDTT